jgi:methyl coenzyme M reductase gamma subunit
MNMLVVHGIYDGKVVKITDKIKEKKKYKVVVTFIEELQNDDNDLRDFSAQTKGLDFWDDVREDIYQDFATLKSKIK